MLDPVLHVESEAGRKEVKNTTCYMCACRCGIRVTLRDGEVRHIEGNPDHPLNKGVICAKGASGIMKQYSPARLTRPLLRRSGGERGTSDFEEISWDQAFKIMHERLAKLRAEDPKKFALFTGRDQMQALTGMFAKQFGTPNYAAHGGFCSVNMAAGLIYTIGGSFWEFGGPDLDRAKLFVMIGTAEDHHSNPLKVAISKFKRRGGRFISINPVRTGYSAIADEWVPIKPGTDGALMLAITHEIIKQGLYDRDFVTQYTNGAELVNLDENSTEYGMFVRFEVPVEEGCFDPENKLWWDREIGPIGTHTPGADPRLLGEFEMDEGVRVSPAFQLLKDRVEDYTPEWAEGITGIPAETIRRLAHEIGHSVLPVLQTYVTSDDLAERAELEHRLSSPLAIFVLALVAVPLTAISPRPDLLPRARGARPRRNGAARVSAGQGGVDDARHHVAFTELDEVEVKDTELKLAHADGTLPRLLNHFARHDVLVIDDWGVATLTAQQRHDVLEIIEDRDDARSTILASQIPQDAWHDHIGDPTIADALLDRVVHQAYKLDLTGHSRRKHRRRNPTT